MKIEMVGLSDVGVARKNNEDSFALLHDVKVGLVCDGMGGHNAGAFASRLAAEMLQSIYRTPDGRMFEELSQDVELTYRRQVARIVSGLRLANRQIYNLATKNTKLKGMGTTAAVVAFDEYRAILAHVGDSRIYRIRDRELILLTEDHSWVNELIQDREIAKEEARFFKNKNVITRALGIAPRLKIDLRIEPVENGDLFILCTDGLTNSLNDDLLQAILVNYKNDLKATAVNLIEMANQVDGSDNITVALMKVNDMGYGGDPSEPIKILLNEENEKISALENRYLKRKRSPWRSKKNWFQLIFTNKIIFSIIVILLTVVIYLLIFPK